MAQTLDDYVRSSKKLDTPDSRARRAVFEHAYTIAVQVVALRQKRGLTQKQLAELSGLAQSEISRIERGSIQPTEPTLVKLATRLVPTSGSWSGRPHKAVSPGSRRRSKTSKDASATD